MTKNPNTHYRHKQTTHTLLPDKSFKTHSRFALPKTAGAARSCWNCARYRKLLELLLVRQSRRHLVAGTARNRGSCWNCSRLAAACDRIWLLLVLAFGYCSCLWNPRFNSLKSYFFSLIFIFFTKLTSLACLMHM